MGLKLEFMYEALTDNLNTTFVHVGRRVTTYIKSSIKYLNTTFVHVGQISRVQCYLLLKNLNTTFVHVGQICF